MKKTTRTPILLALAMILAALLMGGCFRKHIVSTPPSKRPTPTVRAEPMEQPAPKDETPEIIEETYVVDGPENEPIVNVKEGNLDEEPAPMVEARPAEAAPVAEPVPEATARTMDPEDEVVPTDEAPVPMAEMYYVQVGAFSEVERANNVLADLIAQGYKGSKLSRTGSGLYRVQAGAFADRSAADEALIQLSTDFPKGFVLKSLPTE